LYPGSAERYQRGFPTAPLWAGSAPAASCLSRTAPAEAGRELATAGGSWRRAGEHPVRPPGRTGPARRSGPVRPPRDIYRPHAGSHIAPYGPLRTDRRHRGWTLGRWSEVWSSACAGA